MAEAGLALLAGILSTLSPCVLPILPIVLGAALTEHRLGPAALAAGLALSFVSIGLFIATVGFAIGLNQEVFRMVAAVLLITIGTTLLVPAWQARLAVAAGPFGNWVQSRGAGAPRQGLGGQFVIGLLLGAVWIPCVGPTLGAASILAAKGESLGRVAVIMLVFGIGAALPLLVLGVGSREAMMRWRDRMLSAGQRGKYVLGAMLLTVGLLILTGVDKKIEAHLVNASPAWLTELTTRF